MQDFSRHAKCLYDLLSSDMNQSTKFKSKFQSVRTGQPPPNEKIEWTDKPKLTYLVDVLTNLPVMAYPRFEDPYILQVDASEEGLGPVLYQRQ